MYYTYLAKKPKTYVFENWQWQTKKKHFYIITIEVHNLKLCFKKLFKETGQIKSC